MVRNKKEVLSKIGSILTDIREQHAYLSKNIAEVNELEMELLMANATFLVNHVAVLQRMTTMSEPAVKSSGTTKNGGSQATAGTVSVKEDRKNTAASVIPKKREPEGLLATIKSTLASIAIPSDEALREEISNKLNGSTPQVDHPISPSTPEFAAKIKDIEPVSMTPDQKPVSACEVGVSPQNQEKLLNEGSITNDLSTPAEPIIEKRLEKPPVSTQQQSSAADFRSPVHESELTNTAPSVNIPLNIKPEPEVNAVDSNKPGNPIRKPVNKGATESTVQLPSYLSSLDHPEQIMPKPEMEKVSLQDSPSEKNVDPATEEGSIGDEKEEEVKIPNWKLGLRGSLVTSFDFEKKNVDELFDRPLTTAERQVINRKASKKEEGLSKKQSVNQPVPNEIPVASSKLVQTSLPITPDSTKPTSINDRHKGLLGDQDKSVVSKELRAMISLNDKLLFTKDLFKSHGSAYSEAIDQISVLNTFEEVDLFLQGHYAESYGWANKQRTLEKFYSILRKRFY